MVGVVRPGHALARGRRTPERCAGARHISVSRSGGSQWPVDDALEALGLARTIVTSVIGFSAAIALVRHSDLVATVPERHTGKRCDGLVTLALPFDTPGFTVSMLWHPRLDAGPRTSSRHDCGGGATSPAAAARSRRFHTTAGHGDTTEDAVRKHGMHGLLAAGLGLVTIGALAAPASGAPVTYLLNGTVFMVTDGSNTSIDLTQKFVVGQGITMLCTVDVATAPTYTSANSASYGSCVTEMSFDTNGYSGTMSAVNTSGATVNDDKLVGGHCGLPDSSPVDEYVVTVIGMDAPAVNGVPLYSALFGLTDCDATALGSTALPDTISPDFDLGRSYISIAFFDGSRMGTVAAVLANAGVPVRASTWGGLKARYR